ncbi:heparan-alpha-glucosaminide N-acetyltransferase [uncultured Methanomethylovorans sp.]|uniref:heparan-alpha-glucosaminide N-acetyltransferase n=1 Tax=uncultured Methanomethylovorans sp. TaxID=183759 RepID=UPI002AA90EE4|nr:heparan-alpha-glucosaminide N-acetyltransferase [uncultured Methanomethylovorans sp.]
MRSVYDRFWEVDALRGIAIILMVLFHFIYDLVFFDVLQLDIRSGPVLYVGRSAAILFVFLVGVSLSLSHSRGKVFGSQVNFIKYLKRGFHIFLWGLVFTIGSWLLFPEEVIVFGILHFIGVAVVLSYPLLESRLLNLTGGFMVLFLGKLMENFTVDFPWLIWLGLTPADFQTLDYFPLLPWFGVTMLGIFTGNIVYPGYCRKYGLIDLSNHKLISALELMGRKSLLIYIVHQPLLIFLLYAIGIVGVHSIGI